MIGDFEWDPVKAQTNLKKHGVHFVLAATVLEDEYAITIEDDHPTEHRFITLGMDESGEILVVVYTYRGDTIRLISARKANSVERLTYEKG
jgi:uncharacterized DUF497 family protein